MDARLLAESALGFRDDLVVVAWERKLKSVEWALEQAEIVIWKREQYSLALTGYESFQGTRLPSYASDGVQLWCFGDFQLAPDDAGDSVQALLSVPSDEMWSVVNIALPGHLRSTRDVLPKTSEYPRFTQNHWQVGQVIGKRDAQWVALREFPRLKIASLDAVTLPRATRRRMQRSRQEVPNIRIVQLREREVGSGGQGGAREYHHKWIVKGHWRRLHEPRKEDGAEVTFVSAYVKGPQGAPLLKPRESVYVVAR